MRPVPAEAGEETLGHAVAARHRYTPRRFEVGAQLRQQGLGDRDDTLRGDAQPSGADLRGEAREERAVAHQRGRLQMVQAVDDLLHGLADRYGVSRTIRRRERRTDRGGDVRHLRGRDGRDDGRSAGEFGMQLPVPDGETSDGRIAGRPRVPAVDEHAALAARTARGDDVELVEQVGVTARASTCRSQASRVRRRSVTMSSKLSIRSDFVITGRLLRSSPSSVAMSTPARRSRCQGDRSTARSDQPTKTAVLRPAQLVGGPIEVGHLLGKQLLEASDVLVSPQLGIHRLHETTFRGSAGSAARTASTTSRSSSAASARASSVSPRPTPSLAAYDGM